MTGRTAAPSITRSAVANWAAFLFAALVSFFLSPFVVHNLGDTAYGVWVLLGSLVGYLGLLDLGVRGAVTRYVAHFHATGDHDQSTRIASSGITLFVVSAFVAVLISLGAAVLVTQLFNVPAELVHEARTVILLGGLTIAASLIGGVYGGIVIGLERFDLDSTLEIVLTAFRAVAIVIALRFGFGLVALAVIHLAASAFRALAAGMISRHLYPQLRIGFRAQWEHVRMLLSFSIFSSLIQLSGILIYYTDYVVIGIFLPVELVTFYAIAANLTDYARQVVGSLTRIVTPRASTVQASGGDAAVHDVVLSVARTATLITLPIALTFWLRGQSFIALWMGPAYAPQSGQVLSLLAIMVWFGGARSASAAAILGVNKHRLLALVFIIEAVCNLGLSVVLIKPFGLMGVALGTVIPNILVSLALPWYLHYALGVPPHAFYRRAWLFPTLACLPFAVASLAVERTFPAGSLLTFFLQVALLLPLVPACALVLTTTRTERQRIHAVLRNAASRLLQRRAPAATRSPTPARSHAPALDRPRRPGTT